VNRALPIRPGNGNNRGTPLLDGGSLPVAKSGCAQSISRGPSRNTGCQLKQLKPKLTRIRALAPVAGSVIETTWGPFIALDCIARPTPEEKGCSRNKERSFSKLPSRPV